MHSPYVKPILSSWATQNRLCPKDYKVLVNSCTTGQSKIAMVNMVGEEAKNTER